jgi:uncharacterized repeat protein (TIGR01451 family)
MDPSTPRQAGGGRRPRRYIDVSKDTQFTDAWIVLALILLGIGLVGDHRFFTTAAVALLVMVGITWLWSALSLAGLHYTRSFAEQRAFQGEEIRLTLTVSNRKPLPLTWLTIEDIFPAALPLSGKTVTLNRVTNRGEFRTFWMPNAFQTITRAFTIECSERGFHRYGPALIATGDGFGFFGRKATLPEEQYLIVYPRLYSVTDLRLPAKNPFGDLRARGHLFEDPLRTVGVREWQNADDPRRIHWKATARHQQMLSRVYEPSQEQQLLVFLNVATLARHWYGTIPELLERAISVAASLAALAAEERIPVGLIANGTLPGSDQPIRLLPGRSPEQIIQILELLAAVTPFASDTIEALLFKEAPRLGWGATLLVVTATAHDELLATLLELVAAGRRVVLFTLAAKPPTAYLPGIVVYHLPHLVADLIDPVLIKE